MASTLRRVLPPVLTCAIVLALAAAAAAAPIPEGVRARRAGSYIASQQRANGSIPAFSPIGSTADAVLAFVAAHAGPTRMKRALGYLERQVEAGNVTALGLRAKVVIAWAAAGRGPRTIAGQNLVRAVRTGLQSPTNVFDTALGVLATEAADVTPPAPALQFLEGQPVPRWRGGPTTRTTARPRTTTARTSQTRPATSSAPTRTPRVTSSWRSRHPRCMSPLARPARRSTSSRRFATRPTAAGATPGASRPPTRTRRRSCCRPTRPRSSRRRWARGIR